jgi:hypothetical protein
MPRVPAHKKRPICEGSIAIDVRCWCHDRLLRSGGTFTCAWYRGDEPLGAIGVAAEVDAVLLTFEWRYRGVGEWTRACQHVPIVWTRCHLGGARAWFVCTEDTGGGQPCGRRVAKLYAGDSHLFACRWCRRLVYVSQSESPLDRSIRRARKLRTRLGGGPSIVDPFPEKPPRMHRRTYGRLFSKAEAVQECWIGLSRDYLRRHNPRVFARRKR